MSALGQFSSHSSVTAASGADQHSSSALVPKRQIWILRRDLQRQGQNRAQFDGAHGDCL